MSGEEFFIILWNMNDGLLNVVNVVCLVIVLINVKRGFENK